MFDINGKVCIVTGANRGIGRSITETFCKNGAIVYAVTRSRDDAFALLEPNATDGKIIPACFDVRDSASIRECIMRVKREYGKLDVLVNNAGVMQDAVIGMITEKMIEDTLSTNVVAPLQFIQYASKLMKRQGTGSIINMASIVALYGNKHQALYSASKGAIIAMTKSVAKELSPYGVRVNAIAPGSIETDLFLGVEERIREGIIEKISMGRIGKPAEVASACLFLASDASSYVSGQVLSVDGAAVM